MIHLSQVIQPYSLLFFLADVWNYSGVMWILSRESKMVGVTSRNDVSPYKCSAKLIVPRTQCPLDWYIPCHFDHIYVLPHAHKVRGMYQSRAIVFRDGVIYRTRILVRGHIVSGRPVTPLVHKFGSLFSTHYRYCLMKKNGDSCLVSFDWYWFHFRKIY